jgi:hypothetical protein
VRREGKVIRAQTIQQPVNDNLADKGNRGISILRYSYNSRVPRALE